MAGVRWPPSAWPPKCYDHIAVKEAVFPFARFAGVDTILGPEMRSTGEVMGELHELGFSLVATRGTGGAIAEAGIPVSVVNKVTEGRPHVGGHDQEQRNRADCEHGRGKAHGDRRLPFHPHLGTGVPR
jgi:hypothetical protein